MNAIAPGTVLPPDGADPAFREQAVRRSPLHLPGSPNDVAYMVGHLAAQGGFLREQWITVDGGATIR